MNLKSLTIEELTQVLKDMGQPGFRAGQSTPGYIRAFAPMRR